jgi:hypothetical protein
MAVALEPSPAAIGINWYSNFDDPVDAAGNTYTVGAKPVGGSWWIGKNPKRLGDLRGGHCVALKQRYASDYTTWWDFYDQGSEGACVGFGTSHVMTLINRKRYFARWLWDQAKLVDPWDDTNPGDDEGTLVRSALDVLKDKGHVKWATKYESINRDGHGEDSAARAKLTPSLAEGIKAYRWIRDINDLTEVLGYQDVGYVDIVNSWGRYYPHLTRMPLETVERLWNEDGEIGVVVDR